MKIMIHSNGPMVPSGYGRQTALAIRQFTGLGHEVAVSAFHGVTGSIVDWHGTPVYPAGQAGWGLDVLIPHAQHFGADLVLTLMDTWKLLPIADQLAQLRAGGTRVACWMPIDCTPLGRGDRAVIEQTGAVPIAVSHFGQRQLLEAGFHQARYVPHSVDTAIYRPNPEGRQQLRAELGVEGRFVVGICAANRDAVRKAWPEQMRAFDLHRRRHPESRLVVHTIPNSPSGYPLRDLAQDIGIADATLFMDEYPQVAGLIDDTDMALWFASIDVLSSASYAEGFGLPIVEAQACGTPAIGTEASAMAELANQLVIGDEFWNPVHRAWWLRPNVESLANMYDFCQQTTQWLPETTVGRAAAFDVDWVAKAYWQSLLGQLEAGE